MRKQLQDNSIKAERTVNGSIETGTFLSFDEFMCAREQEGWSGTDEMNERADAAIQAEREVWAQ